MTIGWFAIVLIECQLIQTFPLRCPVLQARRGNKFRLVTQPPQLTGIRWLGDPNRLPKPRNKQYCGPRSSLSPNHKMNRMLFIIWLEIIPYSKQTVLRQRDLSAAVFTFRTWSEGLLGVLTIGIITGQQRKAKRWKVMIMREDESKNPKRGHTEKSAIGTMESGAAPREQKRKSYSKLSKKLKSAIGTIL